MLSAAARGQLQSLFLPPRTVAGRGCRGAFLALKDWSLAADILNIYMTLYPNVVFFTVLQNLEDQKYFAVSHSVLSFALLYCFEY